MTSNTHRKNFRSRAEKLEACAESFAAFLRRQHARDTAANVAADTGINATTVEKWLAEAALPQARHLVRLLGAYGPAVLAALIPSAPRWLDDAVRAEELRAAKEAQARLTETIRRLEAV